ncbi:MAG: hypothetical protein K9M57_00860 [Phycisphaerae bacterium]|nr:hypothetical protein [Phycisphaerae bacterium]
MSIEENTKFSDEVITQWSRLLSLTAIHYFVDMFGGMLPVLLPEIRHEFPISDMSSWWLIIVMGLVCNGVQMLVGHLRSDKTTVFFLPIGVVLATSVVFIGVLPPDGHATFWLFFIVIVSGIGIAMVHPEGFRAVHTIKIISPSTCSAIFMTGGILGYGGGAWMSSELVGRWGFGSMWIFAPIAIVFVATIYGLKLSLAAEEVPQEFSDKAVPDNHNSLSFWWVWLMAVPACISIVCTMGFLPTRLNELDFSLVWGGRANMMFVSGAAFGTLFWGFVSRKRDDIRVCTLALFLGIVPMVIYLQLIEYTAAIFLLAPAGFCVMGAYPMMANAARFASGLTLGMRMALIMGGAWGLSSIVFILLAKAAEYWTIEYVLNWMWPGYLISAMIGWKIIQTSGQKSKKN